jgi:RHS repeat-associated protein
MLPAAEERTLALTSAEETFSLAAGVALAALETHQGPHAAQGKKTHQGIFSKNRALRVGEIWVKYSGTHQDRKCSWPKTVSGSALDANGNTLSDPSGKSYSWDFENRLVQAVVPGTNGGTTTFRYDPFGRRIQKSGPLGTTNYLYDGKNSLEEADSLGNVLARYTQPKYIDEPLAELRSSGSSFYEVDALGSITSLTNPGGAIANTYTYDSFGNATNFTGTLANPFRYAARESDSETGLYYYRARYYDPTSGRFISEDPIKFKGGINFYPYVKNDAVNWRDPDGKASAGSWANGWNWGTQGFSWLNCSIQASYCLSGLQGLVNSLQGMSNDAVLNSMAATNTAYNSNLNLKLGCSTGTCLAAFDQCLKAGQAIPLPTPPIPGP